ncbi:relaxase/mobilization nuclease domain-containing protein [Riemerella anatipestifer]|uniref:relaxase/mobilization nuclease domain-containing protein n=1 Tax=Riemerella anatipestifer TaxID=34085 RepID=UPI00129E6C90|nr:relaxase/mobilization nuclease domain-containing protein [Riemerella anatipestifer]MRM86532.1 hypothetical protein [Riemerella anatipestifer]
MIGKAKSVKGSLKGALYKEQQDKQAEIIYQNNMVGKSPRERWEEMKEIANINQRIDKPFIENVISPEKSKGDILSKEEWKKLAKDYAKKMNFGDNQWYAVLHKNTDEKHLHIFVNRVNFSGKNTIKDNFIGKKSGSIADQLAKERGWKTAKEIAQDKKNKIKLTLQENISKSKSLRDLQNKMYSDGYVLELNYQNKNGEQKLNGARIIPVLEYKTVENMSKRERMAKKGFKLSEIDRKITINTIKKEISNPLCIMK